MTTNNSASLRECRGSRNTARGAALASSLILLVALTLMAVTVAYRATMDELMAANQRDALNAMSLADSGIEAGFAEIKANYGDLPQALCDIEADGSNLVYDDAISYGSYAVTVDNCAAGDKATLRSVGAVNGAERVAELLLEYQVGGGYVPSFLADDEIQISDPWFVGPLIHVHSNGMIKVSGAPRTCISASDCTLANAPPGIVSTSDYFDPKTWELETKNPYPWDAQDAAQDGVQPIEVPHVYPPDWQGNATVELTHDCRVIAGAANTTMSAGTEIWNVGTQGVWNGLSCTSSTWEMKSASASLVSAFYYIHGNIKISASQTNPWTASFVAAGNIELTCCMQFNPYGQTGDPIADNIFLLAGNDILVTGSPGNTIDGIIAAHGQVKLSGSGAHFRGAVIAEDYAHGAGQEVTTNVQTMSDRAAYNMINTKVILEGTGISLTGGAGGLVVAGWREIVH